MESKMVLKISEVSDKTIRMVITVDDVTIEIGEGPPKEILKQAARRMGIQERIGFHKK